MPLVFSLSVFAEEQPVKLEFRYRQGQQLRYRYEMMLEGKWEAGEDTPETHFATRVQSRLSMTTREVGEDGSAWVDVHYEDFDLSQTVNGKEVPQEGNLMEVLGGRAISLRYQKDGKVLEVADPANPVKDLSFQQLLEQIQGVFPERPVRPGEGWVRELQLPMEGFEQGVTARYQNNFESVETVKNRRCAKIVSTVDFSFPETVLPMEGETPLKVSVDMMGQGTLKQYFDITEGVMVQAEGQSTTESLQSVSGLNPETGAEETIKSRSTITMSFETELEE